jgi:hypothetical protein
MMVRSALRRARRALLLAGTIGALVAGTLVGLAGGSQGAASLPCDIYAAAGKIALAISTVVGLVFQFISTIWKRP